MTKLQSQRDQLLKAVARLKEAAVLPSTPINQDATIQRFEFTFELVWKVMKTYAMEEGIEVVSPKAAIRQAADLGLIDDPMVWFEFLEARNLTVHTYKEEIAKQVYQKASEFIPHVERLIEKINQF